MTKKQKQALSEVPIIMFGSESPLSKDRGKIYWMGEKSGVQISTKTINSMVDKGLLIEDKSRRSDGYHRLTSNSG